MTPSSRIEFLARSYDQLPGLVMPVIPNSLHYRAVSQFVEILKASSYTSVLDLGTGSGILGISLYRPGVSVTMSDCSKDACELALRNCRDLPITVLRSHWFDQLSGQWDLIIANPPHGHDSDWDQHPEAWDMVPQWAVSAGAQGLDHLISIITQAPQHMLGRLALIHTDQQTSSVADQADQQGLRLEQSVCINSVQMTVWVRA